MPQPNDILNDPRVQAFSQKIVSDVAQLMNQAMSHMQQSLSPAGRVVDVLRRSGAKKTTSPQLLAELNDNMMELNSNLAALIAELQRANDLGEDALDDEDRARKKRRRD